MRSRNFIKKRTPVTMWIDLKNSSLFYYKFSQWVDYKCITIKAMHIILLLNRHAVVVHFSTHAYWKHLNFYAFYWILGIFCWCHSIFVSIIWTQSMIVFFGVSIKSIRNKIKSDHNNKTVHLSLSQCRVRYCLQL